MVTKRESMIQWCHQRESNWSQRTQRLQHELERAGLTEAIMEAHGDEIINGLKAALKGGHIGDHAGKVSMASVASIAADVCSKSQ